MTVYTMAHAIDHKMPYRLAADDAAQPCTSRSLLDAIRVPLLLLHGDRALVHTNPPATRLLERRDCLMRAQGRLACCDARSQQELERSLRETRGRSRSVVMFRSTSGRMVTAALTLVRPRPSEKQPVDVFLLAVAEPFLAVDDANAIAEAFGLTPAEARIAGVMVQGLTPQECADALEVKVSTVRTHLVSIYRKTGAQNRLQLARLILPLCLF